MRLSKIPEGNVFKSLLPPRYSSVRGVRLSKIPEGKDDNFVPPTLRVVSVVSLSKSPERNLVMSLPRMESEVIAARCAAVTSLAEFIPGTAATIASRTCGVRPLSRVNVETGVSSTSVTLIVTVMVSVKLPSETMTVTV